MTPSVPLLTVGIDIGAETTKVVLGSRFSCEIVRSNAGLHTTPTAVSFDQKLRQTGETASQKGKNGILHLNRLLGLKAHEEDFLEGFYAFHYNKAMGESPTTVTVDYNGEERTFTAAAVLGMLLGNIQKSALATMERLQPNITKEDSAAGIQYVLTASDATTHSQLLDAAHAAGLTNVHIVETSTAYAKTYQRKFPELGEGEDTKTVLMVDMGHAQTSVSVVRFSKNEDEEAEEKTTMKILGHKSSPTLGAVSVDVRLWHHFQSTLPKLKSVTPKSRAGHRLLQGSHKLKHLLSQLPDGKVTVENVGDNDTDVSLQATRSTLAELCEEDAKTLKELIGEALKEADVAPDAIEIVGGGCRIPWVQAAIQEAVGGDNTTLSKSLDDTSAALGAALVGEAPKGLVVEQPEPTKEDLDRRNQLRKEEAEMAALDLDEQEKAELRNKIEARVLELRSAQHGKHGKLLPSDDNTLNDCLTELDDWLFSPEADEADRQAMQAKLDDAIAKTQELCKDYYEAIAQEQKAAEKEMEEAAAKAAAENAANGDGEEEDHDNRRLPKKRRMEIVLKNKEEAKELFMDGNWRFAAARYTKALSHCAKFVDLSPDDIKEVTELKVTLNLNLALAYTKMENYDQCLRVCNEAISLDDNNAKAYYRRAATFYEKKKWDEAKQDVVKAKKLAEGDKAIQKLGDRIELQLKKQKQKEKKMASKMFG